MFFIRNYKLSVPPLFLLLILFSTKVCSSSHECCAPSCGSIQNISYPFRLKDHHPNSCTQPGFLELTCENNNVTTIYLNSKRFIVKSITYHNFTIRLLDPGFLQGYSSSCPLHFLTNQDIYRYYFPNYDFFQIYYGSINTWLTYISCSSHININTITKSKSNENNEYYYYYEAPSTSACGFDSHFPAENYSYIVYGPDLLPTVSLKNSCRLKRASMVSKKAPAIAAAATDGLVGGVGNYTQQLPDYTYGFELIWSRYRYGWIFYLSVNFSELFGILEIIGLEMGW